MALKRDINSTGLLFAAVGGIVGSGWLFGPLYAAQLAGPAAILSWAIGGVLMLFIALTFAELATTYPLAGGMVRFGQMSHGPVISLFISWMIWLSSVVVAPVETLALLQYSANYIPGIMTTSTTPMLTAMGTLIAAVLMLLMVYLNGLGAKFFSKSNSYIAIVKLGVPILTLLTLFMIDFHDQNFHQYQGFIPLGWHGVIAALPLAGIVFSFIGYSPAIQLAGEAKNPQRAIPFAIIGAVSLCIILYVLIQLAFVGALSTKMLAHGWSELRFTGDTGPFAGILTALGVSWLVLIIYADAVISPFGTAYIYTASTARVTLAMSETFKIGQPLRQLNINGVPLKAMLLNFCVGMLLFLPFHAWQTMVEFLVSCFIVAYSIGPIALMVLRKRDATINRPFKLPFHSVLCLLAFYICSLLLLWTGWNTMEHLLLTLLVALIVILVRMPFEHDTNWRQAWTQAWWFPVYIIAMGATSYCSSFGGGTGQLAFGWDFAVTAVIALVIFFIAIKSTRVN